MVVRVQETGDHQLTAMVQGVGRETAEGVAFLMPDFGVWRIPSIRTSQL